ncbi:MAG: neutral trehalase, partial [Pseudomonadota bacterium]|nr:neutral trehalase [Pseudomonadota bacterium]
MALALAHLGDVERAWQELDTLLSGQWRDGMVPHIVFHGDDSAYFPNSAMWRAGEAVPTSGITQPPVLATCVRLILDQEAPGAASLARAKALFPKLFAYHQWYHAVRDPDQNGLVAIVHPWESGFDNNPVFDAPLRRVPLDFLVPYQRKDTDHTAAEQRPRKSDYDAYIALLLFFRRHHYDQQYIARHSPFRVADVGVNALLLRADRDLRALALRTGNDLLTPAIDAWIAQAEAGLQRLWTPELALFCPIDLDAGAKIPLPSITGFLPLFSGPLPEAQVEAMAGVAQRWYAGSRYGFPSFDPRHPLFDPRRYCRGPAWFVMSWLMGRGFAGNGRPDIYKKIQVRFLELA